MLRKRVEGKNEIRRQREDLVETFGGGCHILVKGSSPRRKSYL
jgi:hypothetical protein